MTDHLPPQAPPTPPPAQPPYGQQPQYPGQPGGPGYTPPPPTEGMAIAGLITGILFWPVGIFLNPIALKKIRENRLGGRGLAITGLVFSIVGAVGTLIGIATLIISLLFFGSMAAVFAGVANEAISEYPDDLYGTNSPIDPLDSLDDEPVTVDQGVRGETGSGIGILATGQECDIANVGGEYGATPMEGMQFCRVDLTIDNAGDTDYYFSPYSLDGLSGTTTVEANGLASLYDPATENLDGTIVPGASLVHPVYFEVPVGSRLTSIELTEIFGSSVIVTLQ